MNDIRPQPLGEAPHAPGGPQVLPARECATPVDGQDRLTRNMLSLTSFAKLAVPRARDYGFQSIVKVMQEQQQAVLSASHAAFGTHIKNAHRLIFRSGRRWFMPSVAA